MKRYKSLKFYIIMYCISLVLLFASSELLLRLTGRQPWNYSSEIANEPTMYEYDPVLGWKNVAGNYLVPAYTKNSKDIKYTFLAGGMRSTGAEMVSSKGKIVIIGGSFTEGAAVSDEETYPWKLQIKYPSIKVLNYGVPAYGTYQSLLVLERILANSRTPLMVLYGFIDAHERRNVATSEWLKRLTISSRSRKSVDVPYCTIDIDGGLIRHPPEHYPVWLLSKYFATVNSFQKRLMSLKTRRRSSQKETVAEKLLIDMNNICEANETKFTVILLRAPKKMKDHYIKFLRSNDISFIDCIYTITNEMQVPGDGHPNGKMHTLWANCIAEAIDDTITDLNHRKF